MKAELVRHLQCLHCAASEFDLDAQLTSDEIEAGSLTCRRCGRRYAIEDGILMMLDRVSATMAAEIDGWQRFSRDEGWLDPPDDYLLWLPRPRTRIETDTLNWHWHADNFERGCEMANWNGKFVLDIAAGRCWTTRELAKRGARCVATDILMTDTIGLKTAKRYIRHTGQYFDRVASGMLALPFKDGTFDIVSVYASMHHSEDLGAAIREAARVLKPGGEFVLAGEPVGRFYEWVHSALGHHPYDLHERSPRLSHWLSGLTSAGISRIQIIRDAVFDVHGSHPFIRMLRRVARRWPAVFRLKLRVLGGILILRGVKIARASS